MARLQGYAHFRMTTSSTDPVSVDGTTARLRTPPQDDALHRPCVGGRHDCKATHTSARRRSPPTLCRWKARLKSYTNFRKTAPSTDPVSVEGGVRPYSETTS